MQQIRDWNTLASDEVKIGQTLVVAESALTKTIETKPETKTPEVVAVTTPRVETNLQQKPVSESLKRLQALMK